MSSTIQTVPTSATDTLVNDVGSLTLRGSHTPLKVSGALAQYPQAKSFDLTPVIGREYPELNLVEVLKAENSDELLRDLAITISERGVAFFRNQQLSINELKEVIDRLGKLSGKPTSSSLHIHPTERSSELPDDISTITSARFANYHKHRATQSRFASRGWHSDITFEPIPSDFAGLHIKTLPETGGDTLWGSAYEAYDRLSPALQSFLEGLTAIHDGNNFHQVAANEGVKAFTDVRGHPANVGADFSAVHPVIRTNPVTGWKGLFVNPVFTKRIVELSKDESDLLLDYLGKIWTQNHDLQVRFKWNKNDLAIWSNTSTVHSATFDFTDPRAGDRAVSLGEKPYLDASAPSRRQALGLPSFH